MHVVLVQLGHGSRGQLATQLPLLALIETDDVKYPLARAELHDIFGLDALLPIFQAED